MSTLHLVTEDKEATRSQLEVGYPDMIMLIKTTMLIAGCADDADIQGDPKKMPHSVLQLKSVVGVQSYFFRGVSESEFRARSN